MAVRFRTLALGALALLLLGVLGLSLYLAYDPDFFMDLVLRQVEEQIGRRIQVGEARLKLFPRIHLGLSKVVVHDVDPSRVFFTAQRVELVLRATSLLRQQVSARRLIIEQPHLELRRNRDGTWNYATPGRAAAGNDEMGNPLALLLMVRETTVSQGEIALVDEFPSDGARALTIVSVDASIAVQPKGEDADVRLTGIIPGPVGPATFGLAGRITHTQSRIRLTAEDASKTGPDIRFEGTAEALHLDLRQIADFFGPRPVPESLHGTLNLHGTLSLVPGVVGYDFLLSKMSAELDRLVLTGQASISGLMAPQATFALTFASSPISLEDLMNRFPVQWLHPELEKVVSDSQLGGIVEVVTATVTGTALPEPRLSMTGELKISQGRAVVGKGRTPIQDLAGSVFIEADRVRIADLTGQYGPMRIIGGKALVALLETGPTLELNVAGETTAVELIGFLSKTITSAPVAKALAGLRDIKGDSRLELHIAGPIKDPDNLKFVRAEVLARDVWFRSPALPERVVDLNGRIVFSDAGVEFDRLGGRLGRSQFELQGLITTGDSPAYQDFTARARIDAVQTAQWLGSAAANDAVTGMALFQATLGGPLDTPRLKGILDLKDTHVVIPNVVSKAPGTPASVEFEGTTDRAGVLTVERLDLVLPPFRLSAKGKAKLKAPVSFEGTLVSGPISLAGLPTDLSLGPAKDGILEVSLDIKGKGPDWRAWQVGGWVALTDALITPKGLDQPVSNLYLRLKLVRHGAEIKRMAFKIGDSDVRVSGSIRNWHRVPAISLTVESSQLDLDLLIPKGERSPVRDALEWLAATSRLQAFVNVDRGFFKRFLFTDLSWRLTIRDGRLDVDRISGDTDDGHVSGHVVVALPQRKPADFDLSLRATGVPFDKLTMMFGTEERMLTGRVSFSAAVRGREGDLLKSMRSQTPIELIIEDGRILKFSAVSKILTILNLPTLLQGKVDLGRDGMPFDTINAVFQVSNGILGTDKLLVDSPVMKISGAGRYDLVADQLDLVVATSPFGSYSQLLKSIPLFGKLFKGERQGLDTALFEVKGSIKDPQVNYMPVKSFARGLTGVAQLAFDLLYNTLALPKEIVSPSEPEPAPALSPDGSPDGTNPKPPDQPEPEPAPASP